MRNPLRYLEYDDNGKFSLKKTIQTTKDWHDYHKMVRKYRRILKKDAREANPFDYSYFTFMFVDGLKFMREYYDKGINVWGAERRDVENQFPEFENFPTRKEMLDEILEAWDNYQDPNKDEKFYHYHDLPIEDMFEKREDGCYISSKYLDKSFTPAEPYKDMGEAFLAEEEYRQEQHEKFWGLVRDCIQYLWD